MVRIIYIEDDLLARMTFSKYIKSLERKRNEEITVITPRINEVKSFYIKDNNLEKIEDNDIFIIDILLKEPSFTGVDVANKIRALNKECYIIFLTADLTSSITVINSNIQPYAYITKKRANLLKDELHKVINNIFMELNKTPKSYSSKSIVLNTKGKFFSIPISDIMYIERVVSTRNDVNVITSLKKYVVTSSLKALNKLSDFELFDGLRSYLINTDNIIEINKSEGKVVFINNSVLYFSYRSIKKILEHI